MNSRIDKSKKVLKHARITGKLEYAQILLRTIESDLALCRDEVGDEKTEKALRDAVSHIFDLSEKVQSAKNWAICELVRLETEDVKPGQ